MVEKKDKPFLDDDSRWTMIPLSIVGLILVIAGVAGEGYFEPRQSSAETAVREYDEKVLADAIQKAGEAKLSAEGAATAAKNAKSLADAAGLAATNAQKTVDAVGKKAESIEWGLQMSQYFAESRDIRNRDALRQKLSEFKGKDIIFRSYIHDGDGYFLCEDVLSTAKGAGVVATDQCASPPATPPFETGANAYASDEATMLALNSVLGRMTLYGSTGTVRPGPIVVFIGRKNNAHVGMVPPASAYGAKRKKK